MSRVLPALVLLLALVALLLAPLWWRTDAAEPEQLPPSNSTLPGPDADSSLGNIPAVPTTVVSDDKEEPPVPPPVVSSEQYPSVEAPKQKRTPSAGPADSEDPAALLAAAGLGAKWEADLRSWLARRDARGRTGPILVGVANSGFLEITANFVCSLKRLGGDIHEDLLLFTDAATHKALSAPAFNVSAVVISAAAEAGSFMNRRFASMTRKKVLSVGRLVELGRDVIFMDTDTVVLRDFRPPLLAAATKGGPMEDGEYRIGRVDIPQGTTSARGWEYAINYYVNHSNTAFYYLRSGPETLDLMRRWARCIGRVSRSKADDQDVLNGIADDKELTPQRRQRLTTYGVIRRCSDLRVRLPRLLLDSQTHFPSGGDYFERRTPQRAGVIPFIVHNNQIHGTLQKIGRFRSNRLWFLNEDGTSCRGQRRS
eukprot:TRINITY_DN6111_c0_g1_i1.p1 TRINITY_DN6111_c0_g1~~TRINITY_DN6111_c0_g1_i1.p1  ORF type:complete len:426 (+),score=38.67 TRINITY_DN6111_c0_g1_i1:47-1324(+)